MHINAPIPGPVCPYRKRWMETRCHAVVGRFTRHDMQLLLSTGGCLFVSNGTMTTTCGPNKLPPSLRTEQCPRC